MDATRFDDLTKGLATSPSRRAALKTIAATTIGGLLGLAGIGTAFATQSPLKCGDKVCGPGEICCKDPMGIKFCFDPTIDSQCPRHP